MQQEDIYIYVEKFVDSFDMICRMLLMIVNIIVKDDEKKFWKDALVTKSREYGHTSGEDVCVPYVTLYHKNNGKERQSLRHM